MLCHSITHYMHICCVDILTEQNPLHVQEVTHTAKLCPFTKIVHVFLTFEEETCDGK